MYSTLARLIGQIISLGPRNSILEWASPVPFFGDLENSFVATVGINPSNREFVDPAGNEIEGAGRRLTTLTSLGIRDWSHVTGAHLSEITSWCTEYFRRNPYRAWFDVLDKSLTAGGFSYYEGSACHLDLVALATREKWGTVALSTRQRLVCDGRVVLAQIIRDSSISTLILNGRSVVSEFQSFADVELQSELIHEWTLPRRQGSGVPGYQFSGSIHTLGGIDLGRPVTVYGYNHNLQSSFGVTSKVIDRIGKRVGDIVATTTN